MITDYIGGEGSAETPKNDYVIYGWPLMATSFFFIYVMATSFFYIYIDIYKLTKRPVVLLNAIFIVQSLKVS